MAIDTCVGRFSEPADGSPAIDSARSTPMERWDVDAASPAISHRPGSRFGRHGAVPWLAVREHALIHVVLSGLQVALLHHVGAAACRFMNGVEDFDAASFGIQPSEALVLDPQQRLMLQVIAALVFCTSLPHAGSIWAVRGCSGPCSQQPMRLPYLASL